jgi:phage shock protein A
MYGQGLINDEVFNALRVLSAEGKLRPADLAVHRIKVNRRATRKVDSELQNALRGIRSRLTQLRETRANSEKVLHDLEARIADLDEAVSAREQKARQAVGENNEDVARRQLSEKTDLIKNRAQLDTQAKALREDLTRLDRLRTQLETKVAELDAVRTREELANIDGM